MNKKPEIGTFQKGAGKRIGALRVRSLLKPGKPFSALKIGMGPAASHELIAHGQTAEFFFVIRGRVRALIDGRSRTLEAGDFAYLPPGCAHSFRAGHDGVAVLAFFAPPLDLKNPDITPIAK